MQRSSAHPLANFPAEFGFLLHKSAEDSICFRVLLWDAFHIALLIKRHEQCPALSSVGAQRFPYAILHHRAGALFLAKHAKSGTHMVPPFPCVSVQQPCFIRRRSEEHRPANRDGAGVHTCDSFCLVTADARRLAFLYKSPAKTASTTRDSTGSKATALNALTTPVPESMTAWLHRPRMQRKSVAGDARPKSSVGNMTCFPLAHYTFRSRGVSVDYAATLACHWCVSCNALQASCRACFNSAAQRSSSVATDAIERARYARSLFGSFKRFSS
jgi:hypothetical protein